MFNYQAMPKELYVYSDSDWAANKETRKSVSCAIERFGDHMFDSFMAKQGVVALSSGEAEFYGIVRAAAIGKQTVQVLRAIVSDEIKFTVASGSSAARGICNRTIQGR